MNDRDVERELSLFFRRVAAPEPSVRLRRVVATARVQAPARPDVTARVPRLAVALLGLAATIVLAAGLLLFVANRGSGGPGGLTQPGSGQFSATGSMTAARSGATATLLADGRVLIAGGMGGPGGPILASAELYDPGTGRFTPTGPMTIGRAGHTATLLSDGRVLIIGGSGLSSAEVYDPSTGRFTATGSMNAARDYYAVTLLSDGRVLVAGGLDSAHGGLALASTELYDPKSGTFSPAASMTTARAFQTATRLPDGRALITGGEGTSGVGLASTELFDPSTGSFGSSDPMTWRIERQSATLLPDGRVLIAGGVPFSPDGQHPITGPSTSAELFDPGTGIFSQTGSMVVSAEFYTATSLPDGRVLFAGGDFGMESLASAQVYDPRTGAFSQTGSMTVGREGHTATLLPDGRVLIAGGEATGNTGTGEPFASAELYRP
jgi:hypothetical protein